MTNTTVIFLTRVVALSFEVKVKLALYRPEQAVRAPGSSNL
jgi:hypothetical protein